MKHIVLLLLMLAACSAYGSGQAKTDKSALSTYPTPEMSGYADWDSWHYVTESKSGAKYYVRRITNESGKLDLWLKSIDKDLPDCAGKTASGSFLESPHASIVRQHDQRACEQNKKEAVATTIQHVNFFCKTRQVKYLEDVDFNRAGESLASSQKVGGWQTIFPDTVIEVVFARFCVN